MGSSSDRRDYLRIVGHYEACLRNFVSGPLAVDWKTPGDAATRYDVMLGLIREPSAAETLLDFGCGLAELKGHLEHAGYSTLRYTGLDISPQFAEAARARFPDAEILCIDVLDPRHELPRYDYVVMNGIFTRRHDLSVEDMWRYFERLISRVYESCNIGVAFNVMSTLVDWRSDALFHPDPGRMIAFLGQSISRHVTMRNDYGLYETTYYVYRQPSARLGKQGGAREW